MDFKERFKGKTSVINKEGIIGIVKQKGEPVNKSQIRHEHTATREFETRPQLNNASSFPRIPMYQDTGDASPALRGKYHAGEWTRKHLKAQQFAPNGAQSPEPFLPQQSMLKKVESFQLVRHSPQMDQGHLSPGIGSFPPRGYAAQDRSQPMFSSYMREQARYPQYQDPMTDSVGPEQLRPRNVLIHSTNNNILGAYDRFQSSAENLRFQGGPSARYEPNYKVGPDRQFPTMNIRSPPMYDYDDGNKRPSLKLK
jgi:hypothetical protein